MILTTCIFTALITRCLKNGQVCSVLTTVGLFSYCFLKILSIINYGNYCKLCTFIVVVVAMERVIFLLGKKLSKAFLSRPYVLKKSVEPGLDLKKLFTRENPTFLKES